MGRYRYYVSNRYTGFYRRYKLYVVSLIYGVFRTGFTSRNGNTGITGRYLPVFKTLIKITSLSNIYLPTSYDHKNFSSNLFSSSWLQVHTSESTTLLFGIVVIWL
ncbi:hypothetical protein HanXRQr2_Chr14g0645721 [Helianthus annuus]|uniref:Uncharacterized protein n=1 Tax=Helianthus annuus TaxID=4232 RepID=A0A9K3E948_HELAN|nr:hypothetical protein HanXRQr2_Chr14g0645721 [Helianthus annuus]KAJ0464300.1 hypothetical protein HanHA300_Chr14g0525571 [Helianthus annuus]KAJ0485863.1 hypothetical protein HanHA89_Chr14g0573201 [Helianthus annuus]KAJ0840503.1 hypothetical protein HanPSC8_Chr14g0619571 [Helianthus annuus]